MPEIVTFALKVSPIRDASAGEAQQIAARPTTAMPSLVIERTVFLLATPVSATQIGF
jgi:hypothetical protein